MQIIRTLGRCLLIQLIFLQGCYGNKIETGLKEFSEQKYNLYIVAIGIISDINYVHFSPRFKQVKNLKLDIVSVIGSHPSAFKSLEVVCNIRSDINMIAPFEEQVFDKTLSIKKGEKVLVYLGKNNEMCNIVHMSKFEQGKLHFPQFKDQEPLIIEGEQVPRIWEKEFIFYFKNSATKDSNTE